MAGVLAGVATFGVGLFVRRVSGDPNWLTASLIAGITAVLVAVGAPQVETLIIWLRRHKIRLDEASEKLAQAESQGTPTPVPGPAPATIVPDRPHAEVTFICDRTGWARLRVTNTGAGATFSATIQLFGLTAGVVEGRQVFAKWELGDGPHQRLARGETRVLRLATVTEIAPGVRAWAVHRANGEDMKSVELVELVDLTLVADPDLSEPCHLQFLLDAAGDSKMARIGADPPLFRAVPQRVADMRRLLVEAAEYVRNMPVRLGNTKAAIYMSVAVHHHVTDLLGQAFGPRMIAIYGRKLKESAAADLRLASAAFLLDLAQRLTDEEINPAFRLPITWVEFYESDPERQWPEYD